MIYLQNFVFLTLSYFALTFGQTVLAQQKPEQELKQKLQEIRKNKIDTFLVIKSGCIGCEINYPDTKKSVVDGQSIYVLTQKKGQVEISIFDDLGAQKNIKLDTCSIFEYVFSNKSDLLAKEVFYEKEIPKIKSKNGFSPPIPIHHSYEELEIYSPKFIYKFKVLNEDSDSFGINRQNKNWFVLTTEIIKQVEDKSKILKE